MKIFQVIHMELTNDIDEMKSVLSDIIDQKNSLIDEEVINMSQKLDMLLNYYFKVITLKQYM